MPRVKKRYSLQEAFKTVTTGWTLVMEKLKFCHSRDVYLLLLFYTIMISSQNKSDQSSTLLDSFHNNGREIVE